MDDLHNLYRDSQDFGDLFVENYFYEGDLAYNWQYTSGHFKLNIVL